MCTCNTRRWLCECQPYIFRRKAQNVAHVGHYTLPSAPPTKPIFRGFPQNIFTNLFFNSYKPPFSSNLVGDCDELYPFFLYQTCSPWCSKSGIKIALLRAYTCAHNWSMHPRQCGWSYKDCSGHFRSKKLKLYKKHLCMPYFKTKT